MNRSRIVSAFFVLLAGLAPAPLAEVASTTSGPATGAIVLDPGDGANSVWRLVRPNAGSLTLNPDGESRLDLAPDIRINPHTRLPEVVWAYYDDGGTYQVAWSRFDGSAWSDPLLLTSSVVDNAVPKLAFADDGARAVTWRREESPARIWYREEDPIAGWSPEMPVSDGATPAFGPSLVFHAGDVYVSYHEEPAGEAQSRVMVARGGSGGDPWPTTFIIDLVALSPMTGDIEQEISAPQGNLYTAWIYDGQQLGYSRFEEYWRPVEFEPYQGRDDIPRAKIRIKGKILR